MQKPKNLSYDQKLDTLGLLCPEPIMLIRKNIRDLSTNQILYVIADDSSTINDINSFCKFMGHQLIHQQIEQKPYEYWIKKGD